MPLYVVEAHGRAVAAIQAPLLAEAEQHAQSLGFRLTLMTMSRNGARLWDGTGELRLRSSTPAEQAKWEVSEPKHAETKLEPERWITATVPFGDT